MAKKSENKAVKEVVVEETVTETVEEVIDTNKVENKSAKVEVVLKDTASHKNTYVVYMERGRFVEFANGKAIVDINTELKLKEIGVI